MFSLLRRNNDQVESYLINIDYADEQIVSYTLMGLQTSVSSKKFRGVQAGQTWKIWVDESEGSGEIISAKLIG